MNMLQVRQAQYYCERYNGTLAAMGRNERELEDARYRAKCSRIGAKDDAEFLAWLLEQNKATLQAAYDTLRRFCGANGFEVCKRDTGTVYVKVKKGA